MALEIKSTIDVATPLGNCQIQLLLGDITKLPVEQKVDFVFTSAFYGKYGPSPGTLIASLRHNLGINVRNLAKRKEVDLRNQFSCWLSPPLDDNLPFRRLVCFEQMASDGVEEQLSRLFRAMMPIFNNQDTTVITPVLATGSQRKPIDKVLPAMLTAAVDWIRAGLPLRCLKIVLYSKDTTTTSDTDAQCLRIFENMKKKVTKSERKMPAGTLCPYDVCLSYHEEGSTAAQAVVQALMDVHPALTIHSKGFEFEPNALWQQDVYHVMTNSKRIVPLLTPRYVSDDECLEQFSMALCCNRVKKQECVVPLYMDTCSNPLPSYLSLVQYIDCRPRGPDEKVSPLENAAHRIIASISQSSLSSSSSPPPLTSSSSSSSSPTSSSLPSHIKAPQPDCNPSASTIITSHDQHDEPTEQTSSPNNKSSNNNNSNNKGNAKDRKSSNNNNNNNNTTTNNLYTGDNTSSSAMTTSTFAINYDNNKDNNSNQSNSVASTSIPIASLTTTTTNHNNNHNNDNNSNNYVNGSMSEKTTMTTKPTTHTTTTTTTTTSMTSPTTTTKDKAPPSPVRQSIGTSMTTTTSTTTTSTTTTTTTPPTTANDEAPSPPVRRRDKKYDIFVSYSHQHKEGPERLVDILKSLDPEMDIFFDADGLKAGNLWQQTLYEAVENSYCFVAFLTKGYLSSPVCNEEFNLATARQFTKDSLLLLPIHTGLVEQLPRSFGHAPCVDLRLEEEDGLQALASTLVAMTPRVKATNKTPTLNVIKNKLEQQRAAQFREKFCLEGGNVVRNSTLEFTVKGSVMFLFAQDNLKLAAIMSTILKKLAPELVTHLQPFNPPERTRHLECSDMVVVFVSDQLVSSQSLLEELHTVLCRQRVTKDSTVLYLIQSEHSSSSTSTSTSSDSPLSLHLLPYSICLEDGLWKRLERSGGNRNPRPYTVDASGMQGTYRCKARENLALTAASHDVIHTLAQRGSGCSIPHNIVNMAQVENEAKGLPNSLVSVNDYIVSLPAVSLMLPKKSPNHQPVSSNGHAATTTTTTVAATTTTTDAAHTPGTTEGKDNSPFPSSSSSSSSSAPTGWSYPPRPISIVQGGGDGDGGGGGGGNGGGCDGGGDGDRMLSNRSSHTIVLEGGGGKVLGSTITDVDDVDDDDARDQNDATVVMTTRGGGGGGGGGGNFQRSSKLCSIL